ncbi:serum response factor-like isoform X2 [Sinocyclocheilus rhinocerous]|uniref:serum response factor-like isoform X2 n=1 Tax=Sinocyclocheilus rhinocerous TaxID=307959 RepID=UPI0007B81133|nr:PREDICTED: serum response factor-like isoform X2 [Sinocyclocheilus rhinocerous]
MLSSQTGAALSGAGSAAGKSAGHGAVLMGAGVRTGFARGLGPLQAGAMGLGMPGRFEPDKEGPPHVCSGSDADSDSGDENEPMGSIGDNRRGGGVKRERAEMEAAMVGQEAGLPSAALAGGAAGAKPGKKTRGRVKIKMEFIDNKLRRYTTFSKRKTGIMKKAYELSTLTGTQVLLLVASETGHVYTFATRKLQPMITSETGKALIQTCLNSPDSPPRSDPSTDQRMSATGFEETDLTYQVSESESLGETKCSWCDDALHQRCSSSQDALKPVFTVASVASSSSAPPTVSGNGANGTLLKSGGLMQLPAGFTFMSGSPFAPGTPAIPLGQSITASSSPQGQQAVFRLPATVSLTGGAMPQQLQSSSISTSSSSPEISQSSTATTVSLPATIVTSSVPTSMTGHMMYSSPHTVMYASAPTLADGSLAVLNAFTQGSTAMQVSHAPTQDMGGVPQVFLTAPPGTVQIPVSAVQLHPMVIGQQSSGSSSSLTELQVVNLDASHNTKND